MSLGYRKTYVNLIISIQTSTKAEKLVVIGPIIAEIVGGICQFLLKCSKNYSFSPHNLRSYWTDLYQICIKCITGIAILHQLIGIMIFEYILNASVLNED